MQETKLRMQSKQEAMQCILRSLNFCRRVIIFKGNTRINKSDYIYAYNDTRLQTKLNRHARKAGIHAHNVYFIIQTSGDVEANETTHTYTSVVVIVFVQTSYIYLPANIRVCPSSLRQFVKHYYRSYHNHKTCSKCPNLFLFSLLSRMRALLHPAHIFIFAYLAWFSCNSCYSVLASLRWLRRVILIRIIDYSQSPLFYQLATSHS